MKCKWQKWELPPSEGCQLGHGLCVYDQPRPSKRRLIAFVEGFDWFHGKSDTATIYMIGADDQTPASVIKGVKRILKKELKPDVLLQGEITSRIEIVANA